MAQRRLIFLGGLHRSGTSLLFGVLRDHPDISGFENTGVPEDEGQLLQSVYPPARDFGGPGRFGFNERSFLDETSPLVSKANAEKLLGEWGRHWDLDSSLLLEKSPPNLVRTRFLQALFPGAEFIMLLRHPVAVAFATQKWSGTSVAELIEHWLLCHERFAADRQHLSRLFTLKYEDFVSEPGMWHARIHEFLALAKVPLEKLVRPDVNEKYFQRWQRARSERPATMDRIISRFEPRVRAFGYSLDDLEWNTSYG